MSKAMRKRTQELRKFYEAAQRDRDIGRFHRDFGEGLREDPKVAGDFSVRMLFEEFVEDGRELVSQFAPSQGSGFSFREAADVVDTAAFANVFGQITYTRTLEGFQSPEFIGESLVTTIPTQFNGERIPGIGRVGDDAEDIKEGQLYPNAVVGEEWVDTPETIKRGLILNVTQEAIYFDRTGLLLQQASNVGRAIGINKEKRILDTVLGITTSYRRNGAAASATYLTSGSGNINTKTSNALADWTNVEAAELLFDDLVDPTTGEPIMIVPDTIIVPTALRQTLNRILNATEVRHVSNTSVTTIGASPLNGRPYTGVSSAYVKQRTSSASTWFVGRPKEAFAYMENWGLKLQQSDENSEAGFTRDIVTRYKASERGSAGILERRKMVKCTA